ncbi:MAG: hypothetical protein GY799_20400 [Desulfobulbaceae bacterium]|nr:hypothetical protein [Desulfobulbaceae bacterium]
MPIGRMIICLLGVLLMAPPVTGWAMDAPKKESGIGYYRDQDTLPGAFRFYNQLPGGKGGLWGIGPNNREKVRISSFKMDAHDGVADYSPEVRCQKCHAPQTKDLHGLRMGITCVQCHRSQPLAGVYHYYSSLNPIRRHAYVCAKCHDGATPSFASYMVHEPNPIATETSETFPLLFYAVWIMLILAVGVFVFFLPYTALWWVREFITKLRGRPDHG